MLKISLLSAVAVALGVVAPLLSQTVAALRISAGL